MSQPLQRTYLAIDMKCFYASVECAERRLNPFETCLVVADESRGKNALCLAISPRMKALGVKNRCRLSEIPAHVKYVIAPPRMQLYIDYSADIYAIYLEYFSPEDIHVYSIDECFIDATLYLKAYNISPEALSKQLMNEIASRLRIPSTAGIGANLYLAKVALDISAKHSKNHLGYLTEELFIQTLWDHSPITDFWQISTGTAARLAKLGIHSMRGIANCPEEYLYRAFGVNAELLIDHAWGRESCLIEDIKNYRPKSRSVSSSQILPRDYSRDEARVVIQEMLLRGSHELMRRKVITGSVRLGIGYSGEALPPSKGGIRLTGASAANSLLQEAGLGLFDRLADPHVPIRRLSLSFENIIDEGCEGYTLFCDRNALEKEKAKERAVMEIAEKHGKNALLHGTSYLPCATGRERNEMIGGHRAGFNDPHSPR